MTTPTNKIAVLLRLGAMLAVARCSSDSTDSAETTHDSSSWVMVDDATEILHDALRSRADADTITNLLPGANLLAIPKKMAESCLLLGSNVDVFRLLLDAAEKRGQLLQLLEMKGDDYLGSCGNNIFNRIWYPSRRHCLPPLLEALDRISLSSCSVASCPTCTPVRQAIHSRFPADITNLIADFLPTPHRYGLLNNCEGGAPPPLAGLAHCLALYEAPAKFRMWVEAGADPNFLIHSGIHSGKTPVDLLREHYEARHGFCQFGWMEAREIFAYLGEEIPQTPDPSEEDSTESEMVDEDEEATEPDEGCLDRFWTTLHNYVFGDEFL